MFLGLISNVCKKISNIIQCKWIHNVYRPLGLTYSNVTHTGQGSRIKHVELLKIQEDQIHYTTHWNINAIYKSYLTTLFWEFMQSIVDFDLKYLGIYHIVACSAITPFFVLLYAFYSVLNLALEIFLKDTAIKQFLKLLALFCIIFFQDSIFLH